MSESGTETFYSLPSENSEAEIPFVNAAEEMPTTAEEMPFTAEEIDALLPGDGLYESNIKEYVACINPEIEAMKSILEDTLVCPYCKKGFIVSAGEPRDLKCGHCVCSECLANKFVPDQPLQCPDCQEPNTYKDIKEIPVSFTIKQIIQTYTEKKQELDCPKTFNQKLKIHPAEENAESSIGGETGTCDSHSLPIEFGCTTCEQWLCGTCVCLDHSGFPKVNCKVFPIKTALFNQKQQALQFLSDKKKYFEKLRSDGSGMEISLERLICDMEKQKDVLQSFNDKFRKREEMFTKQKEDYVATNKKIFTIITSLTSAKSPIEMKTALDSYFENKPEIYKEKEENDLFDTWRRSASELEKFSRGRNTFYVKWPEVSPSGWAKVTSKKRINSVTFSEEDPQTSVNNALIMEVPFFDLEHLITYPFIDVGKDCNVDDVQRFTFIVDDNPLGKIFINKCCSPKDSFAGCKVNFLNNSAKVLTFGEKNIKSPPNMVKVGNCDRYNKPLCNGALGIITELKNGDSIDVNNLNFYVYLEEADPEDFSSYSFVTKNKQADEGHLLKMCLGEVYGCIDVLPTYFNFKNTLLTITSSGLNVDYEEPSDEEF